MVRAVFLLTGLTPGQQVLWIEGATADTVTNTYGEFEVSVTLSAGFNPLPYTIWMPALDTADAVSIPSPTTSDMVITNPQLPGLELHIPAGTVITDHYGNVVTSVSISPVPIAQPPFPLPSGVRVPLYFTIQPGGAYLTSAGGTPTGAQLYYPNSDQMPPGSRYNFWNYDADPGRLRLVRLW